MAVWLVAGFAGAASAQTAVEEQYADQDGEIPALRARVEEQDASLEARIDEITAVGADLERPNPGWTTPGRAPASSVSRPEAWRGISRRSARASRPRRPAMRRRRGPPTRVATWRACRACWWDARLDRESGQRGRPAPGRDPARGQGDPGRLLEFPGHLATSRQISAKRRDYEAALQEEDTDRRVAQPRAGSPGGHSRHKRAEGANREEAAQAKGRREGTHPRTRGSHRRRRYAA